MRWNRAYSVATSGGASFSLQNGVNESMDEGDSEEDARSLETHRTAVATASGYVQLCREMSDDQVDACIASCQAHQASRYSLWGVSASSVSRRVATSFTPV